MKTFATILAAGIVACLLIITIANLDGISHGLSVAGQMFLDWLRLVLYIGLAVALAVAGVVLWIVYDKRNQRSLRQQDGSFPLKELRARGMTVIVDPNKMIGSGGVFHEDIGWREFDAAAGWDRATIVAQAVQVTRTAQALSPGDEAISSNNGSMYRPGAAVRADALRMPKTIDQQPRPATPELPRLPGPVPTFQDAVNAAQGDKLVLGHNGGKLCTLDLDSAVHAAILGATGTGKTASVGMMAVLQAMRNGYHVIILDPKGGMDWRPFNGPAEWHATDYENYPDQIARVHAEHERRMAIAQRANRPSVRGISRDVPPVLVVIEEIGGLREQMKLAGMTNELKRSDLLLDQLLRLSRASDIHLLLIDQYPEHWSGQMMANTKAKILFKLAEGNKVGDYDVIKLPERGAFRYNREEFATWHVAPLAPKLLSAAPPASHLILDAVPVVEADEDRSLDRSLEGSFAVRSPVRPEVDTPTPTPTNAPNDDTRLAIWAYLDEHPEASQADVRRALNTSKAYTNLCWHEWRNARHEVHATVPDAIHGQRQVVDLSNPAHAAEIERIREEIARGRVSIK